jgi:hypothetical protein
METRVDNAEDQIKQLAVFKVPQKSIQEYSDPQRSEDPYKTK